MAPDVPSRFVREPSDSERAELTRVREAWPAATRARAAIVLLSAMRVSVSEIVQRLGLSRPTVTHWLRRFDRSGVPGLLDRPRSGRPARISSETLRHITMVVSARPRDLGIPGTRWSLARLRGYLVQTGTVPALSQELLRATALLAKLGDDAKVLSGGQSLIPLMKLRLAAPHHLVDINGLPGLAYVREDGGALRIGGLTREADLEESDVVRSRYPLLFDTCRVIADPIVRNLATVGGNLAHGDPANDHPATMLAFGAEVVAVGTAGERKIPIGSFFTGPFSTALRPDEIVVEIRVPSPKPGSGGAYVKMERKVGDFATAAVAVQLTLSGGVCQEVGIGLTNVGSVPIKAVKAEAALRGKRPDEATIKQAAQLAAEAADPSADLRGSVEYKKDLVRVLTARALRKAIERAQKGA